ncbi:MAG: choice-of-anchor H family protein [Candidatus Thiodiazotropha sp. DIVDIV]
MNMTKAVIFVMMLVLGQCAWAETVTERLSQSVEGFVADDSKALVQKLETAEIDIHEPMSVTGDRLKSLSRPMTTVQHLGLDYSIFDAQTVISRDDDDDGYYHRLSVTFDADVSSGRAWVYARLYLSLEGGPWNHYYTTETFPIDADSTHDDYEVVTRLLDGYPSGYYDVLIELYDADDELWVSEYGPYDDQDLAVLPLEDSYRDDDGHYHGGGGVMGFGLVLLCLGTMLVRRGVIYRQGVNRL